MRSVCHLFLLAALGLPFLAHGQGALEPVAPPGPVMKTLDQVEPRAPISTAGTISDEGSYYLTQDIAGRIVISADNVDLDLNGFSVRGGSGTSHSISASEISNLSIHGGTILPGTSGAVSIIQPSGSLLRDLRVLDSPGNGIIITNPTGSLTVEDVRVESSGANGVRILMFGEENVEIIFRNNVVIGSGTTAVTIAHVGTGRIFASVEGNRVFDGQTNGLYVSAEGGGPSGGLVADNVVSGIASNGLWVDGTFLTTRNLAHDNGTNFNFSSATNAAPVSTLGSAGPWDNIEQ